MALRPTEGRSWFDAVLYVIGVLLVLVGAFRIDNEIGLIATGTLMIWAGTNWWERHE